MAKTSKSRDAEQRYIARARGLKSTKQSRSPGTPWKNFFEKGVGSEVKTSISKQSISSIVYTYGKRMGKRFVCSYSQQDDLTVVKIEAVQDRDD